MLNRSHNRQSQKSIGHEGRLNGSIDEGRSHTIKVLEPSFSRFKQNDEAKTASGTQIQGHLPTKQMKQPYSKDQLLNSVLRTKDGTAAKVKKSSLSTINSKAVAKTRHNRQPSSTFAMYTDNEENKKSHSSFLKGRKSVNNLDNSTTNESKTSYPKMKR